MTEGVDRPAYQPIVEDITEKIRGGELPTGAPLPSIQSLMDTYGATIGVVRRALVELRALGLIRSQQGVGSFVQPIPDAPPSDGYQNLSRMLDRLQEQVDDLRDRMARLEHAQEPQPVGPGLRSERPAP